MKYKSAIYQAVHESAVEKFTIGAISEERMQEYDEMCLVQESETAQEATKSPEALQATAGRMWN